MLKKISLILINILVVSNVYALDLSLDDVVNMIMTQSNDIKQAEANIVKAEAQLKSVNSNRWLKVDGSVSYMNLINVEQPFESKTVNPPFNIRMALNLPDSVETPDNIFSVGINAVQPIYTFGKIGNAVDALHKAIDISKDSKELIKKEVKYAAINLYWTAKMTDEIVKINKQSLENTIKVKRKLTAKGRANRINLIKIESVLASKEINLNNSEFNRDTALNMLKIMAGIDKNEQINLIDEFPKEFQTLEYSELNQNLEWDIYQKQVELYKSNSLSKKSGHYPTLAAVGSYSYYAYGTDIGNMFDSKGRQSAYIGLSLQVPIFHGGLDSANSTIEAMNAEVANQQLEKSKKLKVQEYNTALEKYNYLKNNLDKLNNANKLAKKAYNVSLDRFSNGQTSAVELSDASNVLDQMSMALLKAKYDLLMSKETINKLGDYNE